METKKKAETIPEKEAKESELKDPFIKPARVFAKILSKAKDRVIKEALMGI